MAEKYNSQIHRVDGKNCFLEVLNTCMPIGKLLINMCQYDEKTHKEKMRLEFYLDFPSALYLAELIRSGRLEKMMNDAAKTGVFEGQKVNDYTSYFTNMGGTKPSSPKHAKYQELFDWLPQNKCVSKILKVQKSTKYKFMIRGEYGLGAENETGLIVPNGKPKAFLQVPFAEKDALAFALLINIHIQAYTGQFYATYKEMLFPSQQCRVFEAVPQTQNVSPVRGSDKNSLSEDNSLSDSLSANSEISKKNANNADSKTGTTKALSTVSSKQIRLRTRSDLKPLPKDNQSLCLEACTENGTIKYVVFLPAKMNAVDPEKWKRFENGLKKGKMLVDIMAAENDKGTLYFDKFVQ